MVWASAPRQRCYGTRWKQNREKGEKREKRISACCIQLRKRLVSWPLNPLRLLHMQWIVSSTCPRVAALDARFLLQLPNIYGVICALGLHSSGFVDVTYDGSSLEAIHQQANKRQAFQIICRPVAALQIRTDADNRLSGLAVLVFSWRLHPARKKRRPRAHSKASLMCGTADDLLLASGYFLVFFFGGQYASAMA